MTLRDSKERFSDRVSDYVKYRPDYPQAAVDVIYEASPVDNPSVADIGCGTGIFSNHLLAKGCQVIGIEPNDNMRGAALSWLGEANAFSAVSGTAEHTGLSDNSVDIITAAQAFHWFNNDATKAEFKRILRPDGFVALVWNSRDLDDPFQAAYEVLLNEFATDYSEINHMNIEPEAIAAFFNDFAKLTEFPHHQLFDFEGLLGRLHSSSYCPPKSSPEYETLVAQLQTLFGQYAQEGTLTFRYITSVYIGRC